MTAFFYPDRRATSPNGAFAGDDGGFDARVVPPEQVRVVHQTDNVPRPAPRRRVVVIAGSFPASVDVQTSSPA
jgi:hypothetical protein